MSLLNPSGETGGAYEDIVHLCISTNRRGFDEIKSPIIIGTPIKIINSMRLSSSITFKSLNYIVLDEVDRLLSVAGRYATTDDKRKIAEEENPTEVIITNLLRLKKTDEDRKKLQFIAVSATIGRPLRYVVYTHAFGCSCNILHTQLNYDLLTINTIYRIQEGAESHRVRRGDL